ncbi:MAG: hypothetical protein AMXMBFR47_35980 [Planctomycetota bacterium]
MTKHDLQVTLESVFEQLSERHVCDDDCREGGCDRNTDDDWKEDIDGDAALAECGVTTLLQTVEPLIAIAVHPDLHEPPRPIQLGRNLRGGEALQSLEHHAPAVRLLGAPLASHQLLQTGNIVGRTRHDLHKTSRPTPRDHYELLMSIAQYLTSAELRARINRDAYY